MQTLRRGWTVALLLAACCAPAYAQTTQAPVATSATPTQPSCGTREPGDTRPRIGLALGGGGARGIAHISVLKELEALHIPVDCIAGTSMGALVGGLYASGRTSADMEALILSTDWKRLFDDSVPRKERSFRRKHDDRDGLATVGVGISGGRVRVSPGVLQGERILSMFERETLGVSEIDDFDKLPIPFRAVGTDLNTGQPVVIGNGSLPMAMRASMSLPGIFQPMEIDGHVLIDGGVANQVPIDVVRAMGADIVIAVDVGTPLETLDRNASLLQVVSQMSGMLTVGNTQRMLATLEDGKDVLIVPKLGSDVKTGDFEKAARALEIGNEAAIAAGPQLSRLSASPEVYLAWKEHRPAPASAPPVIMFVTLDNETRYSSEFLLSQLDIDVGQPLDTQEMEDKLIRVYSFGTLASITYDVVREGDQTGLRIHAREKPQGPNYIQLGFTLSSDFQGTFETSLRAAILVTPLSKNGAEGRVIATVGTEPALTAEYYRPFGHGNRWMTYTRIGYLNPNYHVFDDDGHDIAEYDIRSLAFDGQFGREFGNYGAAGIGYQRAHGRAKVETGDPTLPRFNFDTGRAYVFARIDRADSLYFPRDGYWADLAYFAARKNLGSDSDYDTIDFDFVGARPIGRNAIQYGASYHSTIDGELPIQDRYRLGGRGKLAGFRINELTGQDYALVFVGYTYQLAEVFGRNALVGGTIEYGNAWENRSDMAWDDGILNASAYLGFDSWFGPMLFGYGWREGGDGVLFLEIGKTF